MDPSAHHDPELDLVLQRDIDIPPEAAFRAWTDPSLIVRWFTPAPWKTVACDLELRPGGRFDTVMESPEGERFPGSGCILEVVPGRRFVWTSALRPGFRPASPTKDEPVFTGVLTFEPIPGGTRYTARAMHPDAATARTHAEMGFHDGWGRALDQLVALMKGL